MDRFSPTLLRALSLTLLLCAGCGEDTMTPAEHHDAEHAGTMTPHGEIQPGAQDMGEGRVQYQTSSGERFETTAAPAEDGYRYGPVEQVEAEQAE